MLDLNRFSSIRWPATLVLHSPQQSVMPSRRSRGPATATSTGSTAPPAPAAPPRRVYTCTLTHRQLRQELAWNKVHMEEKIKQHAKDMGLPYSPYSVPVRRPRKARARQATASVETAGGEAGAATRRAAPRPAPALWRSTALSPVVPAPSAVAGGVAASRAGRVTPNEVRWVSYRRDFHIRGWFRSVVLRHSPGIQYLNLPILSYNRNATHHGRTAAS